MHKMVLATTNMNKLREINAMVADLDLEIISLAEVGLSDLEVEEDGDTYEANALKKARTVMQLTGLDTIADDSGLEVDALNGAPGVYSARFAGEDATYADNNKKLLELLDGVPDEKRTARFVSAIAVVFSSGDEMTVRGTVEGTIIREYRGTNGFGYDPLFWWPEGGCTFAEMDGPAKNAISHRSRALNALHQGLAQRKGQ